MKTFLTYDEITAFTRVAVAAGISRVRITGGATLVRKGVTELVRLLSGIEGITDLSMTPTEFSWLIMLLRWQKQD
ncbi:MAG: hypothetical protein R2756_08820 [Bacteroidales bacterium]